MIVGTITAPELLQFGLTAGTTAAGTLNTSHSALATQFDSTRTQIDQLAKDATFNGTNLLNRGSLRVIFNENSTTSLSVAGVTNTAADLGVAASANTFQTDKDNNDALTTLTNSLLTQRARASVFRLEHGYLTTRESFTKA